MRLWLIVCCLVSATVAQTSQSSTNDAGDLHRLAKLFARADAGKPIRIAFLGGSITQRTPTTRPEERFPNRVQEWFRKNYPDAGTSLLNSAVVGSGSDYGCLRVQRDVLSNVPDVVIVDFSADDSDSEQSASTFEGLVRQILGAANAPALLLVIGAPSEEPGAAAWEQKLGQHYRLPMVSVGDAPKAAEAVAGFLSSVKNESPAGAAPKMPKPLMSDRFADTELAEGEGLAPTTQQGWTQDRTNHCWSATQPGATFEAAMPGRDLFLLYSQSADDSGRVRVTVDDGDPQTFDGRSQQAGSRRQTALIAHDLKNKSHKIQIELLNEKSDSSNGHEFRMFGLGSAGDVEAPQAGSGVYGWRNVPIVGGGFVSGIITHPTEKGLMYARTDIGGAYRRSASEKDWVPITDWIDEAHWNWTGIESLAIDPSDPKFVYLAAGSYTNPSSGNGAVLRSSDQGRTWQITPMPFKMGGNENGRGIGERLNVDPRDGKVLLLGSRNNGLWRSEDRGETWTQVAGFPNPGDTHGVGIGLTFFDARTKTILAGTANTDHCLYRSDDAGQSWHALDGAPRGLMPHHIAEDADGAIYITFCNAPGPNGVTGGAVYKLNLADESFVNIRPVEPSGHDTFGYAGVTVDSKKPGVVMVSTLDRWSKTDQIFRSLDGGETWMALRDQMQHDASLAPWLQFDQKSVGIGHWIADIEVDPSDSNHLLYVTGWGMWETRDLSAADQLKPTHWRVAAKGIEQSVVNDLISPPDGAHLLSVMWDIDGFRHNDASAAGTNFKPNYGGNTSIDFAEARPDTIVRVYGAQPVGGSASGGNGGSISYDNGRTWTPFASRPNEQCKSGTVAISCDGGAIVWTPDHQPSFISHDHGATWKPCGGLPERLRVISDRETPNIFYAIDFERGQALISDDGGETFSAGAIDLPTGDGYLASVPSKPGELWLATEKGVLISSDAGKSFKPIGDFSSAHRVGFGRAKFDDATHPAVFVVGTRGGAYGFYRSDDRGETWIRINDDKHQFGQITAIVGDPRQFGRVYVASRNRGVLVGDPK